MPSPSLRRPRRIRLSVTSPPSANPPDLTAAPPLLPWPLAALVAGVAAAFAGWLVPAGAALLAWFTVPVLPLSDVVGLATRGWLLAHGAPLTIDGSTLTIVPMGLSLFCAGLAWITGRWAAGQAALSRPGGTAGWERWRLIALVWGLCVAGYLMVVAVATTALGSASPLAYLGGLLVCGTGALPGSLSGMGVRLRDVVPVPVGAGLAGWAGGAWALAGVSALVLGVGVLAGWQRIGTLEHGLGLDPAGLVVWSVIALGYLPNAAAWSVAWALGGGLSVGSGSSVTLAGTHLGLLPAIPLLGALPPEGVAPAWWSGFLVSGILIGGVAGLVAALRLLGGSWVMVLAAALGAGVGTAALTFGFAALSAGGMGALRLAHLGPRLPELAQVGLPSIVLSAVVVGVAVRAVGSARRSGAASLG